MIAEAVCEADETTRTKYARWTKCWDKGPAIKKFNCFHSIIFQSFSGRTVDLHQ